MIDLIELILESDGGIFRPAYKLLCTRQRFRSKRIHVYV